MALYTARISLDVTYHANQDEIVTHDRAVRLAEAMRLVLQRSPAIQVVSLEPPEIEYVEQETE